MFSAAAAVRFGANLTLDAAHAQRQVSASKAVLRRRRLTAGTFETDGVIGVLAED
jgi:hypothetical protein